MAYLPASCIVSICAVAGLTGDRMDDVDAVIDEGLVELLCLGLVVPGFGATATTDEGAGLVGSCCEASEPISDIGALLLVVVLDAGIEAVHGPGHAREGQAREGARPCRSS